MSNGNDQPAQNGSIDLNAALRDGNLTLTIGSPENATDAQHRRWKETALFAIALLIVVTVLILSTLFLYEPSSSASAEDKKWVQSLLTLIIGGFMGFLVGKKFK